MDYLKRFFKSKAQKNIAEPEVTSILTEIIENEATTFDMQHSARENAGTSVVLTLAVPLPTKDVAGWFGGSPRLPEDLAWPQIEGTPLCFVAQIDLTQVPQKIWSGVGPRSGQLAFFILPERAEVKVLHVDGPLVLREGPSPVAAHWYRKHRNAETTRTHFPEWPVKLTQHVGELPSPNGWRKGCAPDFPDPYKDEGLNLADPAHHPFSEATLEILISGASRAFEERLALMAQFLETKKLKDDTREALMAMQVEVQNSRTHFLKLADNLALSRQTFKRNAVAPHIEAFENLLIGNVFYQRDDEAGCATIEVSPAKLTASYADNRSGFASGYLRQHLQKAKEVYLEAPEQLPHEVRARIEKIIAYEASYECGGMSHPPKGFIYTSHGPASPNEVLLELPTSDLIGWIWGDMYSLVLTIARDDLAKGRFDDIIVDITN